MRARVHERRNRRVRLLSHINVSDTVFQHLQIRQTVPVTLLRRVEVLFGTVGMTEQCFIEFTLTNASSTLESRLAVEVMQVGLHMEIVGNLLLICGKHGPPVVGLDGSELDAWLAAHKSQSGTTTP